MHTFKKHGAYGPYNIYSFLGITYFDKLLCMLI